MARPWIAAIALATALAGSFGSAAVPARLGAGISTVTNYGIAYRPEGAEGARPLIVLLHGAGQQARPFVEAMRGEADRCGCLLLGVQSTAATWDLIGQLNHEGRARANFSSSDKDAVHIERAVGALVANGSADRRRIVLAGFSDGASYALSIGRAKPRLYYGIIAMAPGFQVEPKANEPSQRIVIAHSKTDRVLPYGRSRDAIFAPLKRAGYRAHFLTYDGGHSIDTQVMGQAIDLVLQSGS